MEQLNTGIEVLDRRLGGGIPAGSTVALVAPPSSSAELFLYELTASRQTMYLSTIRSAEAIRDALTATQAPTGDPTVHDLDRSQVLDQAKRAVGMLGEENGLIIDPVDPMEERDASRYGGFLNGLQTHLQNTKGYAVLHCLADEHSPVNRRMTLHAADIIFNLETDVRGSNLINRLTVPKNRSGRAISEEIKLELVDSVAVDTSRDIA